MSARTSKTAPRAIVDFLAALDGTHIPSNVHNTLNAVRDAIFSNIPAPNLNRSLGQLMRQHPNAIASLDAWLSSVEIAELAASSGCHWALLIWRSACKKLTQGKKAHAAFGMNAPGRPTSTEFGEYEDAAILAEQRSRSMPSDTATASVLVRPDGSELDRREVQRHRKLIRSRGHSMEELNEQVRLIRIKLQKG
jgi:hypothetical protein